MTNRPSARDDRAPQERPDSRASSTDRGRLTWLLLAAVSYLLFIGLSVVVAQHVVVPFDQSWLDTAHGWTALTPVWRLLSDSANYPLIAIGVGIVLWLLLHGERREAILVVVVLAAATAGSEAVKQLVGRDRPLGTDPTIPGVVYSYPSGHTLEAATIYGIIAILIWRGRWPRWMKVAIAVVFTVLVVLVGVARVALAEHYPTDVLAGLLAGIGDLAVFAGLTLGHREREQTRPLPLRPHREESAG
ncbi:MAG TPA: phosphatase PAP2 family protein [Candidatus Limnocylindrales bacterium]|jgi:undecaprenyl-diphosphatase